MLCITATGTEKLLAHSFRRPLPKIWTSKVTFLVYTICNLKEGGYKLVGHPVPVSVRRLEAVKTTPSLQNPQTSFTNLLKWKPERQLARHSNMNALRRVPRFPLLIVRGRGSRHPEKRTLAVVQKNMFTTPGEAFL